MDYDYAVIPMLGTAIAVLSTVVGVLWKKVGKLEDNNADLHKQEKQNLKTNASDYGALQQNTLGTINDFTNSINILNSNIKQFFKK